MFAPGNIVAPDEWPNPLNIPFNSVPSARASLAACTSESPLLHETITWSAWTFAAAALAGHALMPSPARFKPGRRLVDCTRLAEQKSDGPAKEIPGGNVDAAFLARGVSAARPAQPEPPEP